MCICFADMGRGRAGQMDYYEQLEGAFGFNLARIVGKSRIWAGDSNVFLWPHCLSLGRGHGRESDNQQCAHTPLGSSDNSCWFTNQRYRCGVCTKISWTTPGHSIRWWHHSYLWGARHNEFITVASATRDCEQTVTQLPVMEYIYLYGDTAVGRKLKLVQWTWRNNA